MTPETRECFGPFVQRAEGFGFGAVEHVAAVSAGGDQANVLEDAEVFGDARLFEAERGDDVAHGALLRGQEGEDSATTRFCNRVEGVGGGGSARHGNNIYPYRNMSRDFLRRIWGAVAIGGARQAVTDEESLLHCASRAARTSGTGRKNRLASFRMKGKLNRRHGPYRAGCRMQEPTGAG